MNPFLLVLWVCLRGLELLLLLRALLSWFPAAESFSELLSRVTEPIILPMRLLFDLLGIGTNIPFDLPFLCTFFLLSMLSMFLPI